MSASLVPCPHCGEEIPEHAKFCRHCGSSDTDGWTEVYDPTDDFDYDDYIDENFPSTTANTNTHPFWRLVAIMLLAGGAVAVLMQLMLG